MDVIAEVLLAARVRGARTARLRAAAPWGVERGGGAAVVFHLVTRGSCWLRTAGAEPLRLDAGDVVLLPNGAGHAVSSHRNGPLALDENVVGGRTGAGADIELAGPGPRTRLLCAGYRTGRALPASPRTLLPPVVHVPARQLAGRGDLVGTLRMLDGESTVAGPGSQVVIDRLVDLLVVHALRAWQSSAPEAASAGPPRDLAVAPALTALHNEVDRPWTLDELARRCGLSRATFTRRFTRMTGEPPLGYLRRRRMELAARRLLESDDSVGAVARSVGYTSEFAFSRAFTRTFGVAPSRHRGTGGEEPAPRRASRS